MNMANLEIPITENADNIEKAEAYTKELDNVSVYKYKQSPLLDHEHSQYSRTFVNGF